MSIAPLSTRLETLISPFLEQDETAALNLVPEPLKSLLARFRVPRKNLPGLAEMMRSLAAQIDALEAMLDDPTSRARLFEFFAAKILGPTRYGMTARARWIDHLTAHAAIAISPGQDGFDLHALEFEGVDLRYLAPFGNAISPFLERQYFLERDGLRVRPETGETALDIGAGAGDTALAFAAAVGAGGRVLACEPTPSELTLQARNLAENPELARRITTVPAAVSDQAGQEIFLAGETTHAHIAPENVETGERAITTTVDALAAEHALPRLDFIKLDIEGMELAALMGAAQSLRRFRPKLAVCVYHGWQILEVLPWLRATLPDYELHLENHSPLAAETVLYARPAPK